MIWYVRVRRMGAVLVEMRRDFGMWPLVACDRVGPEWMVQLPFMQIILTPAAILQQEMSGHARHR